ncbi:MAG: alanine racemase [Micavibrio sp.]|nr:alanine racemase [Micavibrio sp.]
MSSNIASNTASAHLTIDLNALADNYRQFQAMTDDTCEISGVIKANAYGLGAKQVFNKLKSLGCPQIFVATLDEALSLRVHDKKTPIAVLGGLFTGAEKEYLTNNITPVLNTPHEIKAWSTMAKNENTKLPTYIHFDTGMNRLGLSADEARALINDQSVLNSLGLQLIMSHFACADDKDHPFTQEQADKFAAIATHFPNAKKSLSNSPGLFTDPSYHYDLARPGYALYGGNPTPHLKNPMKPVVHLKVRVLQVRNVKKGETVGYAASHTFKKDTRTATVALGYADGFLRSNSGSKSGEAKLYYNDTACNVLGRVSMDLVSIDIDHLPNLKQGDWIEVLGHNQSVDALAHSAGTIGYEILTSLGNRYKRYYIGAE